MDELNLDQAHQDINKEEFQRERERLQAFVAATYPDSVTPTCLGSPLVDRDRLNAHPEFRATYLSYLYITVDRSTFDSFTMIT
ncbi:hypothetical protein TNCV_2167861 [Trichonephila clavipes]|nr:hypothetical protein TNCV_2167861 [Trichonephila clavipes]